MTTLITGATGFVGSAVARRLIAEGHRLRALVRPDSDRRNLAGLDCELAIGDLARPETLGAALAGCRALFHVAADYRLWTPEPERLYRVNVAGTRALLLAAAEAGVERVVYTSSVATLRPRADGHPADESDEATLADMIGHYKRSKFLAEQAVRELAAERGLDVVIVNPSAPVGPRDIKPTPTGRLIRDAALGRVPAFVETGLNVVHVDDVAAGHLLAFERGERGERYILGGEDMSLRDILARVAALAGRTPPRLKLPRAPLLPLAYLSEALARLGGGREPMLTVDGLRMAGKLMYFSSAKAERALGYRPRPAAVALEDAVRWFAGERAE